MSPCWNGSRSCALVPRFCSAPATPGGSCWLAERCISLPAGLFQQPEHLVDRHCGGGACRQGCSPAPPAAGLFCQRLCRHGGGAGTALCRDRCPGPDQRADGRFARHLRLRPPQHIRRTGVRPGIGYACCVPKVRWVDCLLVFAVGVFLLVGPASRSAALCTLALAVGLVFCRLRAGHSVPRWWPGTCAGMVGLTAAVSYLLPLLVIKVGPWNNDIGPAWLAKLDSLLTCRISLTWMAYRLLDVKIAGRCSTGPQWITALLLHCFSLVRWSPRCWVFCLPPPCGVTPNRAAGLRFAACLPCCLRLYGSSAFHLTTNPTALLLCGAVFAQTSARWQKIE